MDEETLIIVVQPYKELYDMSNPKYSNHQRRETCWEEISRAMKQPAKECKLAWIKLRDGYRKAMKARKTVSGAAASKRRPWKFEIQMSFLSPYLAERATLSNLTDSSTPESQHSQEDESVLSEENENDVNHENEGGRVDDPQSTLTTTPIAGTSNRMPQNLRSKNGGKKSDIAGIFLKYIEGKRQTEAEQKSVHPIDHFFSGIAETVKSFPIDLQLEAKGRVFNMIHEYELQVVRASVNTLPTTPTPPTPLPHTHYHQQSHTPHNHHESFTHFYNYDSDIYSATHDDSLPTENTTETDTNSTTFHNL